MEKVDIFDVFPSAPRTQGPFPPRSPYKTPFNGSQEERGSWQWRFRRRPFPRRTPWLLCSFGARTHGCCVPRSFLRCPGEDLRLLCSEKKADRKEDKKEYSVTQERCRMENIHYYAYPTGRETSGYEFVARQGEEQICDIEIFRKIPHLPSVRT